MGHVAAEEPAEICLLHRPQWLSSCALGPLLTIFLWSTLRRGRLPMRPTSLSLSLSSFSFWETYWLNRHLNWVFNFSLMGMAAWKIFPLCLTFFSTSLIRRTRLNFFILLPIESFHRSLLSFPLKIRETGFQFRFDRHCEGEDILSRMRPTHSLFQRWISIRRGSRTGYQPRSLTFLGFFLGQRRDPSRTLSALSSIRSKFKTRWPATWVQISLWTFTKDPPPALYLPPSQNVYLSLSLSTRRSDNDKSKDTAKQKEAA